MATGTRRRLGLPLLLTTFALAMAPMATATDGDAETVAGNPSCAELFADVDGVLELDVDPPQSGTYVSADGQLDITLTFSADLETVDWVLNSDAAFVLGVFVKAGADGSVLYTYDLPTGGDTDLSTTAHAISHVQVCYVLITGDEPACGEEGQPGCPSPPECPDFVAGIGLVVQLDVGVNEGTFVTANGAVDVTVDFSEDMSLVAWTLNSDSAVVLAVLVETETDAAVFVYDATVSADAGLTVDLDVIVNVVICLGVPDDGTPPTCEANPDLPECDETGCQTDPELPECDVPPTCADNPDRPECQTPENPCVGVDVLAVANTDGTVTVTVVGAEDFTLWRKAGEADWVQLDAEGSVYEDHDVQLEHTYTYKVMVDGVDCAQVEVTAIPEFPTVVGLSLAAAGGALAFAYLRRRQA